MKIIYFYPPYHSSTGTERILIDKMSYWGKDCGYDITMLTYDQRSHSLIYPIYQRVYHIDLDYLFIALYQYFYLTCLLKNNKSSFLCNYKTVTIVATTYHAIIIHVIAKLSPTAIKLLESHIDRLFHLKEISQVNNIFKHFRHKYNTLIFYKYLWNNISYHLYLMKIQEYGLILLNARPSRTLCALNRGEFYSILSEKQHYMLDD